MQKSYAIDEPVNKALMGAFNLSRTIEFGNATLQDC